jgi:hypothetical protein
LIEIDGVFVRISPRGAILMAIKEIGPKLYGAFSSIAEALPGIFAFGRIVAFGL